MMQNSGIYDCIVIGGGASGLMLAASLECRGLILEATGRPGAKLMMSGGGRCNITHGGSIKDFIGAYGGDAGHKLRKCLYRHSNIELAGWLEDAGIMLAGEDGEAVYSYDLGDVGRIFPASMRSRDIFELLLARATSNGWKLQDTAKVHSLERAEDDACWNVGTRSGGKYRARNVVIASGGITYPGTGSDGSMFPILGGLGVDIAEPRPALTPVFVRDFPYEDLKGVSIPDVTVTAFGSDAANTCKGKAARMTGDLLFTHRGFSGPVILNISRYAEPGQLIRIRYNKELGELPKRMRRILEDRARGDSGDIRTGKLAALLDADDFTVAGVDENGMVTAGGISLDCMDVAEMRLAVDGLDGLYAIGEAIDADGITGGYNLQMCWSTARTAADSIRRQLADDGGY